MSEKVFFNDIGVFGDVFFHETGGYINFDVPLGGSTAIGFDGFGFRVLSGELQYKHKDGIWRRLHSGLTGPFGFTGVQSFLRLLAFGDVSCQG